MKNKVLIRSLTGIVLVTMPFWFSSCKKDGSEAVTPNGVEGTWTYAGLKINPALDLTGSGTKTNDLLALFAQFGGADVTTCFTTSKVTFASGGKLTGVAGQKCNASTDPVDLGNEEATWRLDGTKMTISSSSGAEVYDTALSGNSLKLSQTDNTTDYDGDGKNDEVTITLELTR
jgi:hypothetical protein